MFESTKSGDPRELSESPFESIFHDSDEFFLTQSSVAIVIEEVKDHVYDVRVDVLT